MGFRIGAGFGPLYVSKSIGGRRRRRKGPAPSLSGAMGQMDRDLGDIARMRAAIDALPREDIRKRHAFGWVGAAFLAACFLALGLVGIPMALIPLAITWWGHRKRWERVAARELHEKTERARRDARDGARQAQRYLTPQDQEWLRRHEGTG